MALLSDLINLDLSDCTKKIIAEYIWVGGSGMDMRSKARTLSGPADDPSKLPKWNFDGSSTGQAPGDDSEVILCPQAIFRDPFRKGKNILVMCDCYEPNGKPIPSNKRYGAATIFNHPDVKAEEPWFGIEQEYTLLQKDTKGVFDMGQIPSAEPRRVIFPCLIFVAQLGAWPAACIFPSLSWLWPHAPRVSFLFGLALAELARAISAGGGRLWRARARRGKLPRAPLPAEISAYINPLPPSLTSPPPFPNPLPLRYQRRWGARCRRSGGLPRACSPFPRWGSASRRRASISLLLGSGEAAFFLRLLRVAVVVVVVVFSFQICYFLPASFRFEKHLLPRCSPESMAKWYVVFEGLKPGIYSSWYECSEYVLCVKHARYQSYKSHAQAVQEYNAALRMGTVRQIQGRPMTNPVTMAPTLATEGKNVIIEKASAGKNVIIAILLLVVFVLWNMLLRCSSCN